jgi:hypothetical protein
VARYECNVGFTAASGDSIVRCLFGEWKREGDPLHCRQSWSRVVFLK